MDLDEALTVVVVRDGDRLLRVGFQLTHERAAAQDLVQEALLRVYSAVRRGGREPRDWYAYLRRAVINEFLRTCRLRSGSEVVAGPVPEAPPAESAEGRVDDRAEVLAALGELSARHRTVTSGYQRLVAALNALPARTSTWGCSS
jgi:DNA-directed RNA polymerase specialized sigma24 family protein